MTRGTTATPILRLPFAPPPASIETCFLTFSQGGAAVCEKGKADMRFQGRRIYVLLTQEDTLAFQAGVRAQVQLRIRFRDGRAAASRIIEIMITDILKDGVI